MLTIVVTFYNESEVIPTFLPKLVEFSQLSGWKLVLINDGSTDNTLQLLKEYENLPQVRVIYHKVNRGYGGALKSGLSAVTTPFAITIDGDGQHDLKEIPKFFDFFLKNRCRYGFGSRKNLQKADRYSYLVIGYPYMYYLTYRYYLGFL
jgi:glycosyltransferase involved in cell wall biosynthesis